MDMWAQWLLHRRHGGDPKRLKATLDHLYPIRDRILNLAGLSNGDTLLDVGCGDGLIAFGALECAPSSRVIFSDVSQDLLDHARVLAQELKLLGRCQFLCASAEDLSALGDASVEAVTTRSVLIYVGDKQKAFQEFYRVLRPGGRLAIFEPIDRFAAIHNVDDHMFWGFDITPVTDMGRKVKAVYFSQQSLDSDPMMNFDERDLLACAERSGFSEIRLDLQAQITPCSKASVCDVPWEVFLRSAANPKIPTLEEAMASALTSKEAEVFGAYMRPLWESKAGTLRQAAAYLWAMK
jgi:ubiquinone/menaquinone biosynthesis C-methylase UbiE